MPGENRDKIERQLHIMREEFQHTMGALLFIHPQNKRTEDKFDEAYFKLRELLFPQDSPEYEYKDDSARGRWGKRNG